MLCAARAGRFNSGVRHLLVCIGWEMMRILSALLLVITVNGLLLAQTTESLPPHPLVFTHVTVIDVMDGTSKSDLTVIVVGKHIVSVSRNNKVKLPPDALTIEAGGKFLIPGLWDMHVHTLRKDRIDFFFPFFIANGVTGVRDMGSAMPLGQINQLRNEIKEGKLLGPRIVAAGPAVDGPETFPSSNVIVTSESEARRTVDSLKRQGADFIKIYNTVGREAFFAIADECKKQGIPFVGHLPFAISAAEASNAGQKSFEHMGHPLGGLLWSCSTKETEIRKKWVEAATQTDDVNTLKMWIPEILDTYSEDKAKRLIRKLAKNKTWQCPTFVAYREFASFYDNCRCQ